MLGRDTGTPQVGSALLSSSHFGAPLLAQSSIVPEFSLKSFHGLGRVEVSSAAVLKASPSKLYSNLLSTSALTVLWGIFFNFAPGAGLEVWDSPTPIIFCES